MLPEQSSTSASGVRCSELSISWTSGIVCAAMVALRTFPSTTPWAAGGRNLSRGERRAIDPSAAVAVRRDGVHVGLEEATFLKLHVGQEGGREHPQALDQIGSGQAERGRRRCELRALATVVLLDPTLQHWSPTNDVA